MHPHWEPLWEWSSLFQHLMFIETLERELLVKTNDSCYWRWKKHFLWPLMPFSVELFGDWICFMYRISHPYLSSYITEHYAWLSGKALDNGTFKWMRSTRNTSIHCWICCSNLLFYWTGLPWSFPLAGASLLLFRNSSVCFLSSYYTSHQFNRQNLENLCVLRKL